MNFYLKAWLAAATLPVWTASSVWFDMIRLGETSCGAARAAFDARCSEDV